MADPATTGIFLSYRREDTRHVAGRLFDRLSDHFGPGDVFMDVDSIEPGLDFGEAIERAIERCRAVLVLIGESWTTAVDEQGLRRLDDPDDLVVLEVRAALERDIRVIPVLVDGAPAPRRADLPADLAPLSRRNALRVDHETFRTDVAPLIEVLERALRAPVPEVAAGPPGSGPADPPGGTGALQAAPPAGPAPTAAAGGVAAVEVAAVEVADTPADLPDALGTRDGPGVDEGAAAAAAVLLPRLSCAALAVAYFCWALLLDEPEWSPAAVGWSMVGAAAVGLGAALLQRRRDRTWLVALVAGCLCCVPVGIIVVTRGQLSAAAGAYLLAGLVDLAVFVGNGGLLVVVGLRRLLGPGPPRRGLLLLWSGWAALGLLLKFLVALGGNVPASDGFLILALYPVSVVLLVAALRKPMTAPAAPDPG